MWFLLRSLTLLVQRHWRIILDVSLCIVYPVITAALCTLRQFMLARLKLTHVLAAYITQPNRFDTIEEFACTSELDTWVAYILFNIPELLMSFTSTILACALIY